MTRGASPPVLPETASQTAGPYVHIGLMPARAGISGAVSEIHHDIAGRAPGERIRVEGHIFDGSGAPVTDAVIEVWQADTAGVYASVPDPQTGFRGWGRVSTDFDTGLWAFETIKPGAVGAEAPHIGLWIVARGLNIGLHTRIYFDDGPDTAHDPLLMSLSEARRATLVAKKLRDQVYGFDIRLQGAAETVFLDL